jgi:dihydrofolate reductase
MGRVVYWLSVSLDGFIETKEKSLEWCTPSQELMQHFVDEGRKAAMFLLGRRTYDLMAEYWPTADAVPGATDITKDYSRIWREKPKVVFSRSPRKLAWSSRLVTQDVAREVTTLKPQVDGDLWLGGPNLAATFIERGLVDEYRVYVLPIALGSGTPYFLSMHRHLRLRLMEEAHTFGDGVVRLRYEPS